MHDTALMPLSNPPNANPAFWVPAPPKNSLAVIKAPPTDHDEPLYSSVHEEYPPPPNANPAF